MARNKKISKGSKVRVIRVPVAIRDDPRLEMVAVFENCVGHTFVVCGLQGKLMELEVGSATGKLDTIWIEADCVELVG